MKMLPLVLLGFLAVAADAAVVQPADPVATLEWLAGRWVGDSGGTAVEEVWLAPKGGLMLGLHRETTGGKAVSFEFLRIEASSGTMTYHASPEGAPATSFKIIGVRPQEVTFANPEHDFPQRIKYWLDAEGRLHARVDGTENGKPRTQQWVWQKEPAK